MNAIGAPDAVQPPTTLPMSPSRSAVSAPSALLRAMTAAWGSMEATGGAHAGILARPPYQTPKKLAEMFPHERTPNRLAIRGGTVTKAAPDLKADEGKRPGGPEREAHPASLGGSLRPPVA